MIRQSVILPGVVIGANCRIERTIIGNGAVIEDGCELGCRGEGKEITVVGEKTIVAAKSVVACGAVVE